ncbi:TetR/AcrR family transcriptional regulator [Amycolatopsis acidicola]|uniref:TetR/AcrR family transcriptional regulator n=1 Tax=Amycolatopsis acidicola TaxID=2596893 RepID=A0A5N0UVA1_9PSEU|nr:TetR/AcrR family transcriptional regulator [Amycolatopsis acidicola]KAA9156351.1 TetR/AcrR family transcriptional regulator [Amycolatopsis acidicola]
MATPDTDGLLVVTAGELELPTRRRLLLAAERLFAERGIDAVSLRAIMAGAGTNIASVHYHFGSKESLVKALIAERGDEVFARRAVLLDELERPGALTAEGLARAFVLPVAEMALSSGASWVRFISGIMATGHPALSTVFDGFVQQARRFTELTAELHPDWSPGKARFRLAQAMRVTFTVLGDLEGVAHLQELSAGALSREEIVAELEDLVTTVLSDPVPR